MDIVVVVLVVLAVVVMIFRKFSSFVYYICMVDILLRILDFIANNVPVKFLSDFINTYIPNSVNHIIDIYTSGIFTTVLIWAVVIIYAIFDYYIIRTFWHKG